MLKNIAIFGGSGFIGKHLVELLIQKEVNSIYILDIMAPQSNHPKIIYINCDIRLPIKIKLPDRIDVCYHLAALAKEPGFDWDEYFLVNYIGTKNVIGFCEKNNIKNIIFASTMMVYRAGEKRNSEDDLTAPDTAYGISKIMAEFSLKQWAVLEEHSLKIVRPGVVFGKGENGNYIRLYKALKRNLFFYVGRKNTVKASIYVKDLVRFMYYLSLSKCHPNELYNFVYPIPLTIEEICKTMLKVFGWRRIIPVVPFKIALFISYIFEFGGLLGIKTSIHHRRIEKLFHSTNISSELAFQNDFKLEYNFIEALDDWKKDCSPRELY